MSELANLDIYLERDEIATVIASAAKQSIFGAQRFWITSLRSQ
jgi:hypothetical protein